ncbi:MAG TPA: hypothetical protein VH144_03350 [Candidatus Saccharimonadales bacterium]|nr:hypothetical protein [Candidatus Saccharimonadales bacterium]
MLSQLLDIVLTVIGAINPLYHPLRGALTLLTLWAAAESLRHYMRRHHRKMKQYWLHILPWWAGILAFWVTVPIDGRPEFAALQGGNIAGVAVPIWLLTWLAVLLFGFSGTMLGWRYLKAMGRAAMAAPGTIKNGAQTLGAKVSSRGSEPKVPKVKAKRSMPSFLKRKPRSRIAAEMMSNGTAGPIVEDYPPPTYAGDDEATVDYAQPTAGPMSGWDDFLNKKDFVATPFQK